MSEYMITQCLRRLTCAACGVEAAQALEVRDFGSVVAQVCEACAGQALRELVELRKREASEKKGGAK